MVYFAYRRAPDRLAIRDTPNHLVAFRVFDYNKARFLTRAAPQPKAPHRAVRVGLSVSLESRHPHILPECVQLEVLAGT